MARTGTGTGTGKRVSTFYISESVIVTRGQLCYFIGGPILEVMQYEADPWTGLSKLTAPVRMRKIQVISLVSI